MDDRISTDPLSEVIATFENAPSLRFLKERIDRLDASADAKAILLDIAGVTLTVGGRLIAIGRKVMAFALDTLKKFQTVAFGVIIALVLSAVIAAIPVFGPAISALLTPVMLAFGIIRGALEDFRNMSLQSEIDALKQRMSILSAHLAV